MNFDPDIQAWSGFFACFGANADLAHGLALGLIAVAVNGLAVVILGIAAVLIVPRRVR